MAWTPEQRAKLSASVKAMWAAKRANNGNQPVKRKYTKKVASVVSSNEVEVTVKGKTYMVNADALRLLVVNF